MSFIQMEMPKPPVRRYKVVIDGGADSLSSTVEHFLKHGWELQGGVSFFVNTKGEIMFAQALTTLEFPS